MLPEERVAAAASCHSCQPQAEVRIAIRHMLPHTTTATAREDSLKAPNQPSQNEKIPAAAATPHRNGCHRLPESSNRMPVTLRRERAGKRRGERNEAAAVSQSSIGRGEGQQEEVPGVTNHTRSKGMPRLSHAAG